VSSVDDGRALRRSVPDADGLARLSATLGEPVVAETALHGGVASSTWKLATPTRALVLKRFRADDASAPLEWERLHHAVASPVPTPEPVAFDGEGRWFGTHALVVTYLAGRTMFPPDPEAMGRTLAAIHATTVAEPAPPVLTRQPLYAKWEHRVEYPPGVVEAIRELQAVAAREPTVFCHGDFHPGNVLVDDTDTGTGARTVTGVIDWSHAVMAARGFDVGMARGDLAILPGGDAPDRMLAAYTDAIGADVPLLRLFDVFAAARALEWGHRWVEAWTDAGIPMTVERIHDRARAFAEAALS